EPPTKRTGWSERLLGGLAAAAARRVEALPPWPPAPRRGARLGPGAHAAHTHLPHLAQAGGAAPARHVAAVLPAEDGARAHPDHPREVLARHAELGPQRADRFGRHAPSAPAGGGRPRRPAHARLEPVHAALHG